MKQILFILFLNLAVWASAQSVIFEDGFESYDDFSISNIGDWTLADQDELPTGSSIADVEFPNKDNVTSYIVFNSTATTPPTETLNGDYDWDWSAHAGQKCMTAFYNFYGQSSDWLISPAIQLAEGSSSNLSFWGKGPSGYYPNETFNVLVSTTGTEYADFTSIGSEIFTEAKVWKEFTYDLSSYAGQTIYVAIQYTSDYFFGLLIDDFKVAGENNPEIEYCDLVDLDCELEKIESVIFSDLENLNTGCGTAAENDYTNMVAHVQKGENYEMKITITTDPGYDDDNLYFFIDWNQNGNLKDDGEVYEVIMHTGIAGEYTLNVTVPDDAILGDTRLRIGYGYNASTGFTPIACPPEEDGYGVMYGEYEDYTVNVAGESTSDDCDKIFEGEITNALNVIKNISSPYRVANDVIVEDNTVFHLDKVLIDYADPGVFVPPAVNLFIYADNNDSPGELVQTFAGLPVTMTPNGPIGPLDRYKMEIPLSEPFDLEAEGGDKTYWIALEVPAPDEPVSGYWLAYVYDENETNSTRQSLNSGETWETPQFDETHELEGSMTAYGTCETLSADNVQNMDFSYYPNPAKDILTIQSKKDVRQISVYNLAGQSINQTIKFQNGQVNIGPLPQGVYFFKVILEGGQVETFKVIKK